MWDDTAVAFLVMSCVSITWQVVMFHQLLGGANSPAYRGLVRTSVCRIAVATLYVLVGINALIIHVATLQVTFGVFTAVQVLWCVNALLDVRLRRHLPAPM